MKFKQLLLLFLLTFTTLAFSQQEASVWYFGDNAGVKFNTNGTITALTDGQLNTIEGCATLADNNGNLLFYTDGITVYNKNHQVMINGSGLLGHSSSTQSATIVPLPGSTNLFYIFTLDAFAGVNGFRYSIVDLSLNGGLGAVTSQKNILIYTPSNEKLAVIKHSNNVDYWVVTHGWNNNSFYSYLLTSSGLNPTPVVSNVGTVVSGSTDNVWGYMKIAPNGSKLAISNTLINSELMDFDIITGIVSNPQTLYNGITYGVEFSSNSEVLYVSVTDPSPFKIIQFDLTSGNIPASLQTVYNSNQITPAALQLGPDRKIYIAEVGKQKLGVISNPEILGAGCNLQMDAIDLAGRNCELGLPPFVTSFFYVPAIQFNNVCVDELTNFHFNTNQTITNATWDFGDGITSNDLQPTHIYTNPGTYTVSVVVTSASGTGSNTRDIVVYPKPIINSVVSLKQCDDNIDGFSVFNLTEANSKISTNYLNENFTYFRTLAEAQSNINPILNFTTYTNQIVSNDVVFVRVSNSNDCYSIAQLDLVVSTTQIPVSFNQIFTKCDDAILGTNTDGIASFDFSSVTNQIQSVFPVGQQLMISYYRNLSDALAESNAITNITNYRNIGYPITQNIYIRVDSQLNNDCLGLGSHITLHVEPIPIVNPIVKIHCDDDQDGLYGFDTTTLQADLLNGLPNLPNVSVAYFDENNNSLVSPLPNPFLTQSQTIRAVVTNNTPMACNYETTIKFIVDKLPEAFPIPTTLTTACDDELNPALQDGKYPFDTSAFQAIILNGQAGMIVHYFDQNNNTLPSPLPNPFVSDTQNIKVEVINPANTTCKAILTIPFIVKPVPNINLLGDELVCSNLPSFTKILDADIQDGTPITDYTYLWKLNGNTIANENNYSLTVNQEGVYTVEVFNNQGCSRTRTITVTASDIAIITNVEITDLSNNNSIIINVIGNGDYVYSLNNIDFQQSNIFTGVDAGLYNVYVKDMNGCGIVSKEIAILGIPDYFTPNGDGFNDYWNIKGVNAVFNENTMIYIFDRFGKFLKQISPTSLGWDGNLNNQLLPASDYWYSIQLKDGRNLKGHFALKR